jgi:hypothetical protein
MLIQDYSRVKMGLTNIEMQPVIHFYRLRGSFIFILKKLKQLVLVFF